MEKLIAAVIFIAIAVGLGYIVTVGMVAIVLWALGLLGVTVNLNVWALGLIIFIAYNFIKGMFNNK